MSSNEKTNKDQRVITQTKKYGVVLCPSCGYIQGREIIGSVFKHKGAFESVECYRCRKRIHLAENLLFTSDSAVAASEWLMVYKNRIPKNQE